MWAFQPLVHLLVSSHSRIHSSVGPELPLAPTLKSTSAASAMAVLRRKRAKTSPLMVFCAGARAVRNIHHVQHVGKLQGDGAADVSRPQVQPSDCNDGLCREFQHLPTL